MTDPITPAEFDMDAWLSGATKPTRSAKVFQRGDLLAEIDELAARIQVAELANETHVEESLTEKSLADALRDEYAELVEVFNQSALTVRLTAHTKDEQKAITTDVEDPFEAGLSLISEAITPAMSTDQLRKLHSVVGEFQFAQILGAYNTACKGIVEPSADFLPKPSTATVDES